MEPLYVVMPDGSIRVFDMITPDLDSALRSGGTAVVIQGNTIVHQYTQRQFDNGWLLDNCPINVIMGMGWLPGQQEALADAGIVCPYAPTTPQEYIPPEDNRGCPDGFVVSDDETGCVPATTIDVRTTAPMPITDDAGEPVTVATQTSVTPRTYTTTPTYSGDGGMYSAGGGGNGEPAPDESNMLPLLIGAAVLFLLVRG